jgi:hypothetical protein
MGALLHFDISGNGLKAEGCKILAEVLKGNQVLTTLIIANNGLALASNGYTTDISGVTALADAMPGMGALIKLDISRNDIGAEQEGVLQRICVAGGIELANQAAHETHQHQR